MLKLRSASPDLVTLPPIGLEYLSWEPYYLHSTVQANEVLKIASLTTLTKLELHRWKAWCDVQPLRCLPLKELVLINCNNLELDLFVPSSLTCLEKLHIEDICWRLKADLERSFTIDGRQPSVSYRVCNYKLLLRNLGELILSLPNLRELSGRCSLYEWGMADKLQTWKSSKYQWDLELTLNSWTKY